MKIINNGQCYIQSIDIDYLINNDKNFNMQLNNIDEYQIMDEKYIRITNEKDIEYILSSNIPDYKELYKLDKKQIKRKMKSIMIDLLDETTKEEVTKSDLETLKIRENLKYMLIQLEQMLKYKENKNLNNLPNIADPTQEKITNGIISAQPSLRKDSIVFYAEDNTKKIDEDIDKNFIIEAYKLLKDKLLVNEDDEKEFLNDLLEEEKMLIVKSNIKEEKTKKEVLRLIKNKMK